MIIFIFFNYIIAPPLQANKFGMAPTQTQSMYDSLSLWLLCVYVSLQGCGSSVSTRPTIQVMHPAEHKEL